MISAGTSMLVHTVLVFMSLEKSGAMILVHVLNKFGVVVRNDAIIWCNLTVLNFEG